MSSVPPLETNGTSGVIDYKISSGLLVFYPWLNASTLLELLASFFFCLKKETVLDTVSVLVYKYVQKNK